MSMSQADTLDLALPFHFEQPLKDRDGKPLLDAEGRPRLKAWRLKVSARTFEQEAEFSRWLEERAYRAIQKHRHLMTMKGEYQEAVQAWLRMCATDEFAFGKQAVRDALLSREGWLENAYLHLLEHDRSVTRALVAEVMKDRDKLVELDAILGQVNSPFPKGAPEEEAPGEAEAPAA